MVKVNIQHGKLLEPFFNFYVKNSPDVKGAGWKEWNPPDKEEIEKRIEAYKNIWVTYEEKVINGVCSSLGLFFEENIDIYIVAGINREMSNPIIISSHHLPAKFVTLVAHELVHRIFKDKDFKFSKILLNKTDNVTINNHILVYSVLREIFENDTELLKMIVPVKIEEYKKAYELSKNYEDILKFFRDNK